MKDFKFRLGDVVEDTITSFKGVVTMQATWLNCCNTYGVQPKELKDGIPQERQNFDEPQLKLIERETLPAYRETGGPERKVMPPNRL